MVQGDEKDFSKLVEVVTHTGPCTVEVRIEE
jgi:hypothetical protein